MKAFSKIYNYLNARSFYYFLRGVFGVRGLKIEPISLSKKSRVLLFTCAGIGDTLTDSVVFRALAETYPGIFLGAVIHRRRRALAEHNPYVTRIYDFSKGWFSFWKLYRKLKSEGPWDAILQLRGNDPEPRALSYLLAGGRTLSVPQMTQYQWLCGHTVAQPDWDETHGVLQTLRLAHAVGAKAQDPHLVYEVQDSEARSMEGKIQGLGATGAPRLVLQLGGGRRASWRDWPVEHYAKLMRSIFNPEIDLVVLGGKDHRFRAQELETFLEEAPVRYIDAVGKLSLAEAAALLKSARVVVSTDTGMMHLSFAVGTRVVALIHCNNPSHRVGPYGYGERHRVLQLPRPNGYESPADASMADLTPQAVQEKIQELWS